MKIHLWLNGKEISDEISPDMPLLEYVRTKGCYSVKRGCETSNCGLCTVWMNKKPVLSCSVLAARKRDCNFRGCAGTRGRIWNLSCKPGR